MIRQFIRIGFPIPLQIRAFIWISIIAMALLPSRFYAQQYTFIPFGIKEGLVQSQVRCLTQDHRGFIWAGTLGGLSRFDGRTFQNFDRNSGLLNNQVNCVIELEDGTMAMGCNGSIALHNGLGIVGVPLPDKWKEVTVNCLFQHYSDLWIGTENGLLIYSLTEKKISHLPNAWQNIAGKHIKSIIPFKSNEWLVLTKDGLWSVNQEAEKLVYAAQQPDVNFFDLAIDSDRHIWIATKGMGLIQLNSNFQFITNHLPNSQPKATAYTNIVLADDHSIWLTSRYGFARFNNGQFTVFTVKNGLPTADVRDLLMDRDGNIWLATNGKGIQKFTGDIFQTYSTVNGLSSDAVMSIIQDDQGSMWYSTFDGGICHSADDSIYRVNIPGLTSNGRFWTSLKTEDGDLWFGSSDGLFRLKDGGKSVRHFTEKDSLQDKFILDLFQDSRKRLWVGTTKGVSVYQDNSFHSIALPGQPQKRVRCIREDKSGALWMAGIEGLFRFDGKKFTLYSQRDGLAENSIFTLEVDEFDQLWVGTQSGISLKVGDQFITIQVDQIAGANVINFIKYHEHTLWLGTNNGLYSAPIHGLVEPSQVRFRGYSLEDGLRSLETNLNSTFIDKSGVMWFGTTEGAVAFFPQKLLQHNSANAKPPLLSLNAIQINLQDQKWFEFSKHIDSISGLAINPQLNYKQNHLTFFFTGISTTYPADVEYQYMLQGLDEDWKNSTYSNSATYSNLPYRHFNLLVRARSRDGLWSDILQYPFEIKPPYWLTWWFILIEACLAIGIIAFIVYSRIRTKNEQRQKEGFEMKSKMLVLEQQSLNSSMNRHFIFNALNSIQYYINRQDRMAANRYLSDFAKLIRKNLDNTEENLTTLRDELERLELYLKLEHMRFKDKFDYQIIIDPEVDDASIKVPPMLVQPFLENSIWHGLLPKDGPGQVILKVSIVEDYLQFTITDNGVGIEHSLQQKTTTDSHISKGMEITKNRLELIQKSTGQKIGLLGPSQLEDEHGTILGTTVTILLPQNLAKLFHGTVV